jgi:hypothetical protein
MLILSGCATSKVEGVPFSVVESAPPSASLVYFYRLTDESYKVSHVDFRLNIDGQPIGVLPYGYFKEIVNPGTHIITSEYPTNPIAFIIPLGAIAELATKQPGKVIIVARPGETIYIKLHGVAEFTYFAGDLSQMPENVAIAEIKDTNLVK